MMRYLLIFLCFLSSLSARVNMEKQVHHAIEEMRIAIIDLQQTVANQKMDISLLEERGPGKFDPALIQRRLSEVERIQETIAADLHQLSEHANRTNVLLTQYRDQIALLKTQLARFEELQGTLQSISKAISSESKAHTVSSGDSLDKIARRYHTTVEAIKQQNKLSSNTILIGQQLIIPEP